jgi:hypothetical protein
MAHSWQDHGKCVMEFRRWDSCFLPHGVTINAQYYSNLLCKDVHQVIQKKKLGKLSKKIILLHDNVCPHMANLTKVTVATMGWEIVNHLSYCPDLTSCFGPMMHLGQEFQTDDEHKHGVLKWLCCRNITFYAAGTSNLPWRWKKWGSVKEEYFEKKWEFGSSGMYSLFVKIQSPGQRWTILILISTEFNLSLP